MLERHLETRPTLLEFPCDFPIKVFGLDDGGFDALIVGIIRRHVADLLEGAVNSRPSRGGKYLAVTITVKVENREQLDAIYRDLTAEPSVLMAL